MISLKKRLVYAITESNLYCHFPDFPIKKLTKYFELLVQRTFDQLFHSSTRVRYPVSRFGV